MKSETFIFENYYNRIGFSKEIVIIQWNTREKKLLLLPNKFIGKLPDSYNTKEHYRSFLKKKKKKKSVKQAEIIAYQPKTFENPKA